MRKTAFTFVWTMLAISAFTSNAAPSPKEVSIPTEDGGLIYALEYGSGPRGVVLAHGGQYKKESWEPQAILLVEKGFHVVAFDLRGFGESRGPSTRNGTTSRPNESRHFDVLAAVGYLRSQGATTVAAVGASMGGDYVAQAAEANPQAMDRIVLLASGAYTPLVAMKGPKLFIMAAEDIIGENTRRITKIREQFEKASDPKNFVVLSGSAHAQALFITDQGPRVMDEILQFLSSK